MNEISSGEQIDFVLFCIEPEEREQTAREQSINRSKLPFFPAAHKQALSGAVISNLLPRGCDTFGQHQGTRITKALETKLGSPWLGDVMISRPIKTNDDRVYQAIVLVRVH